ncbi:MAG: hypothetical protein EOO73_17875 [Myxococcales bacterium]|nr:MAG: hypothetical protein EOO73_17875 [Myxococcales bacterium]
MISTPSFAQLLSAFLRKRWPAVLATALGTACGVDDALIGAEDAAYAGATGSSGSLPSSGGGSEPMAAGGKASGNGAGTAGRSANAEGSSGADGTIEEVAGALDGRLMQFACANANSPVDDCDALGYAVDGVVHPCSEGKSEMVLDHPIAGAAGTRFRLTLHFYGIMEPKNYGDAAVREAAPGAPDRDGGVPTSWATAPAGAGAPINSYDSYELRVHDAAGVETARHYLNASPNEGHWTLLIDYEKTIEVEAGGFVRLRRFDNNCRLMKNCGATGMAPCESKARTVELSAAQPPAPEGAFPAGFEQPDLNQSASHAGQWWMVDVTAVAPL